MALPHLLLVDDSEAILAFERATLSAHYQITTASNGVQALEKLNASKPDLVLLDLSMPEMDGTEVFRRMKESPALASIPVIVVSSERERASELLKLGARAYLPKPIRADQLVSTVNGVLEDARRKARVGSLAILPVVAGGTQLAIPLDTVRTVLAQPATQPLPVGRAYLREVIDLHGQPVCVLQLARRLGQVPGVALADRKLVVVRCEGEQQLAICVDQVHEPEEIAADRVLDREALALPEGAELHGALVAFVQSARGLLPVIEPAGLLSGALSRALDSMARSARRD
jgi:CheY-like chemotaxis protein